MVLHDPALDELRANTNLPFAQARAMPKSVYTSPSFAALEQQHIFAQDWLCAGRSSALPNVGDYLTMSIAGEPVILLRGCRCMATMSSLSWPGNSIIWPMRVTRDFSLVHSASISISEGATVCIEK